MALPGLYLTVFRGFFGKDLACHCEEPQATKQSLVIVEIASAC